MKRLAMSVLMSALSTGAFANTVPQAGSLITGMDISCEQKAPYGVATARSQCVVDRSNQVVSMIQSETEKFREAYYEIAEMDDPSEAFDLSLEEMENLELVVRGYEGFASALFDRVSKRAGADAENRLALESTKKVIEAFSEFRAVMTDINHLARQCLSDDIDFDCELEPNQEFFVAMTNATESALTVH